MDRSYHDRRSILNRDINYTFQNCFG